MPRQRDIQYLRQLRRLRRVSEMRFRAAAARVLGDVARRLGGRTDDELGVQLELAFDGLPAAMARAWTPLYVQAAEGVHTSLRQAYGWRAQPLSSEVVERAGERIVSISGGTRRRTRSALRRALRQDLDTRETEKVLRRIIASRARVALIARTEIAIATNQAAAQMFAAEGENKVETLDGPECGWDGHDDPQRASGRIVMLAEAERTPISHPRCVRAYVPTARGLS